PGGVGGRGHWHTQGPRSYRCRLHAGYFSSQSAYLWKSTIESFGGGATTFGGAPRPASSPGSTATSMSAWRCSTARSGGNTGADGGRCTRRHGLPDWVSLASLGRSDIPAPRQPQHEHRRRAVLGKTERTDR